MWISRAVSHFLVLNDSRPALWAANPRSPGSHSCCSTYSPYLELFQLLTPAVLFSAHLPQLLAVLALPSALFQVFGVSLPCLLSGTTGVVHLFYHKLRLGLPTIKGHSRHWSLQKKLLRSQLQPTACRGWRSSVEEGGLPNWLREIEQGCWHIQSHMCAAFCLLTTAFLHSHASLHRRHLREVMGVGIRNGYHSRNNIS